MLSRLSFVLTLLIGVSGIAACDASGYRHSDSQWTHGDDAFTPRDPATFKALDDVYARDALRGYCRGAEIAESDGASFAALSEHEARDQAHVYYCETYRKGQEYWSIRHLRIERIEGADPASYAAIGRGYSRDKRRVYAEGVPFAVRDVAGFVPLDGDYARDSQRGYYARVEIPGSHGPSFETIDEHDLGYARDRAHAYYGYRDIDGPREPNERPRDRVRTLRDVDVSALRVLGRGYAADSRHVWHRGQLVAAADASSFSIDSSYQGPADATDRSGAWQSGKQLAASK